MITDKVTRILILFYNLCEGKYVNKKEYCVEHGIAERSFDRDIEDIRLFLTEIYSGNDIVYDRDNKGYHLAYVSSGHLSGEETIAILNLILGAHTLCDEEKYRLLESLISVTETSRRQLVDKIIKKRLSSVQTDNDIPPLMKLQWDIGLCLTDEHILELVFKNQENATETQKIRLMDIVLKDGELYLKAHLADEEPNSPLLFPLKKIERFRVIK